MSNNRGSRAAAVRASLNHPVIDSDGHWVEFGPQVTDYLKRVGGTKAVEGFKSRPTEDWHLTIALKERRERRLDQPLWWGTPAKNTLDHATSMLPKLLYQRLDDFGFDFVVLYPTMGLRVPFIAEAELRQVTCHAFNTFSADLFREYQDRLTPVAVIPMHTPEEAIVELEYVVRTLGLKVVMMTSLIRRPIESAIPIRATANGSICWRSDQCLRLRPGVGEMRRTGRVTYLPLGDQGRRHTSLAVECGVQPYRSFRRCRRGSLQGAVSGRRDAALPDA